MSNPTSPGRSLVEILDSIRAREELAEIHAMDKGELEKEALAEGYDPARMRATIAAARSAAYAKPVVSEAPPAAPPSKVVDFAAARAKKAAASTRWGLLSAAAAVALLVGGSGARYAAQWRPATTVTYATEGKPLSSWERALPLRWAALRLCAQGYYGECEDGLDQARTVDPDGENNAAVKKARLDIALFYEAERPGGSNGAFSKPKVGPKERPLQRHP